MRRWLTSQETRQPFETRIEILGRASVPNQFAEHFRIVLRIPGELFAMAASRPELRCCMGIDARNGFQGFLTVEVLVSICERAYSLRTLRKCGQLDEGAVVGDVSYAFFVHFDEMLRELRRRRFSERIDHLTSAELRVALGFPVLLQELRENDTIEHVRIREEARSLEEQMLEVDVVVFQKMQKDDASQRGSETELQVGCVVRR